MIWTLNQISDGQKRFVGGKALSLARMVQNGIRVPAAICIGTEVYEEFVSSAGLRERIFMELSRKQFEEMRWEEIWDASLRIRNMFATATMPAHIRDELSRLVHVHFGDRPTVIRSSAPGEDASATSFAGLHESYVNVKGTNSIIDHIRLVWASLWSDRALLYRRELGLHVESSTMAVLIQELVEGERSGIAFGVNPNNNSQGIIEAVHGLNQGLVDGTVEPDRWILARKTGDIISHTDAKRDNALFASDEGIILKSLEKPISSTPPLKDSEVKRVFALTQKTERLFKSPQDVEWTYRRNSLYALQSRPITSGGGDISGDKRSWYLSLTRSFENLKKLRRTIEDELIPQMIQEAESLAKQRIEDFEDSRLASEIERRMLILKKWEQIYEDEFIPFAHGARLFGQVYNDTMQPADPYEFTDLLGGTGMASIQRNEMLAEMAAIIRTNPSLRHKLENHSYENLDRTFDNLFNGFIEKFGEFTFAGSQSSGNRENVVAILLQMASRERTARQFERNKKKELTKKFLSHFEGEKKTFAAELLELGRASYQLRDDDNIYLGKIESRLHTAIQEARNRLTARGRDDADWLEPQEVSKALTDPEFQPRRRRTSRENRDRERLRARQIVGQPAGPGIGTGNARVIVDSKDLFSFKAGEILVCDAIDPNMTFIVPLAAGIVERRGGMLIHGAIIAREYGIPCVTGVANATSMIHTGQYVTVDGFLGIVIIGKPTLSSVTEVEDTG